MDETLEGEQDHGPTRSARWTDGERSIAAHGTVAFLADADGTSDLAARAVAFETVAGNAGLVIDAFVADCAYGPRQWRWRRPSRDLLNQARAGRLRSLLVGDVADLAADRDDALLVAVLMAELGVRIIEVDGGMVGRSGEAGGAAVRSRAIRRSRRGLRRAAS